MKNDLYEILTRAMGGEVKQIAHDANMHPGTLHDMCNEDRTPEPHHLKVVKLCNAAIDAGVDPDTAMGPIRWINEQLGYSAFKLPDVDVPQRDLVKELAKTIEEFGDLASSAGASLSDGKATPKEARAARKEAMDLIRQTLAFCLAMDRAAGVK